MIKLGSKARDKVTGLEGIIINRSIWIHGDDRYGIQPMAENNKDKVFNNE